MRQDAHGNRSQIAGDAPNRFLPTIVLADSTRYALGPSPLKSRHCYGYSPQDQPTEPIPVVPAQPAAESDKPEHPCLLAGAGLLFWSLLMFAAGMVTAGALVSLWWWFG